MSPSSASAAGKLRAKGTMAARRTPRAVSETPRPELRPRRSARRPGPDASQSENLCAPHDSLLPSLGRARWPVCRGHSAYARVRRWQQQNEVMHLSTLRRAPKYSFRGARDRLGAVSKLHMFTPVHSNEDAVPRRVSQVQDPQPSGLSASARVDVQGDSRQRQVCLVLFFTSQAWQIWRR